MRHEKVLEDTRSALVRFMARVWDYLLKMFVAIILVTFIPMYYFGFMWLMSNRHYISKLFTVRAMNVQQQTVEIEIK